MGIIARPRSAFVRWRATSNTNVSIQTRFNGLFRKRSSREDLNILVKKHIQTVLSQSPSKAMATLEHDASELIAAGMVTLNAKFLGVEDEKLIARVVEIWGFFWDQVLPYVEGVSWVEYFCC
jgi:hypothetical protein